MVAHFCVFDDGLQSLLVRQGLCGGVELDKELYALVVLFGESLGVGHFEVLVVLDDAVLVFGVNIRNVE